MATFDWMPSGRVLVGPRDGKSEGKEVEILASQDQITVDMIVR